MIKTWFLNLFILFFLFTLYVQNFHVQILQLNNQNVKKGRPQKVEGKSAAENFPCLALFIQQRADVTGL
jgi:hypothetical protein